MRNLDSVLEMLREAEVEFEEVRTGSGTVLQGRGSDHLNWAMLFDSDGKFVEFG